MPKDRARGAELLERGQALGDPFCALDLARVLLEEGRDLERARALTEGALRAVVGEQAGPGQRLLRRIKARYPGVVVIMMTAFTDLSGAIEAIPA